MNAEEFREWADEQISKGKRIIIEGKNSLGGIDVFLLPKGKELTTSDLSVGRHRVGYLPPFFVPFEH